MGFDMSLFGRMWLVKKVYRHLIYEKWEGVWEDRKRAQATGAAVRAERKNDTGVTRTWTTQVKSDTGAEGLTCAGGNHLCRVPIVSCLGCGAPGPHAEYSGTQSREGPGSIGHGCDGR